MNSPAELRCIWCTESSGPEQSPEHIVPEALGCPEALILRRGEVCGRCNNGLAHLDQSLIDDLEFCTLRAGVSRKKGRPPAVYSYGNVHAEVKNGHLSVHINMNSKPVLTHDGKTLAGYRGRPRDVAAQLTRVGALATVNFDVSFGKSPKVARALVKMGAEYFCSVYGRDHASTIIAGPVADFVREGKGERPVIFGAVSDKQYLNHFGAIGKVGETGWYCVFRLAVFEIVVDLGPDRIAFNEMSNRLYRKFGTTGWSTLPPEACAHFDDA